MKVVQYAEVVIIKQENISLILDNTQIKNMFDMHNFQNETGGVIYGYKLVGLKEYRITGFTTPYQEDKVYRYNFERLDPNHLKSIKSLWVNDCTTMYLGDWHSHPSNHSSPSILDKNTWYKIATESKSGSSIYFFFIISKEELLISAYNIRGKNIFSVKLKKIMFDSRI
jgi:integrative and conjugative element protein (TIGR02256 family)